MATAGIIRALEDPGADIHFSNFSTGTRIRWAIATWVRFSIWHTFLNSAICTSNCGWCADSDSDKVSPESVGMEDCINCARKIPASVRKMRTAEMSPEKKKPLESGLIPDVAAAIRILHFNKGR